MELRGFMHEMILTELEDAVGVENVSHSSDQKLAYGTDYFWLARMTVDKGGNPALPDYVVRPGCAEEVSKVLKIANYYKLPVQTWGGGSGSQGAYGRRHSPRYQAHGQAAGYRHQGRNHHLRNRYDIPDSRMVRKRAGLLCYASAQLPYLLHRWRRSGAQRHRHSFHQIRQDR